MALPFQPVPKTVEITVEGTQDGNLVENKYYAQALETITSTMVDALAGLVANWVGSTMLPLVSSTYAHRRVVARDLSVEAGFESINVTQAGNAGTLAGIAFPGGVSIAIHRATGFSGKKAKSRVYWPGISHDSQNTADTFNAAFGVQLVSALETLRQAILADSSATWSYGYPQRILDGVRLSIANFVDVFGHSVTDLFYDSQRRRLSGRGQ